MNRQKLNYKLLILIILVFCFGITSCKKREPESPFTSQLPDYNSTLTVTSSDEISESVSPEEDDEQSEVMSIEIDTKGYIAPEPKQIQIALKNAGYYKGNIDGKIGPESKKAIVNFQKDNGLKVDGVVGPMTWSKLKTYLDS